MEQIEKMLVKMEMQRMQKRKMEMVMLVKIIPDCWTVHKIELTKRVLVQQHYYRKIHYRTVVKPLDSTQEGVVVHSEIETGVVVTLSGNELQVANHGKQQVVLLLLADSIIAILGMGVIIIH